ncbi:hypothetical protein [Paenibacillus soyae]|uniref:Leucine-rich repeat domain-containing protein n=1 Tax=Paenibacillus soyae TaxID=2969249 RepID=A0A9X2SAK1_9BACL|nr:hypothetical protein [Paenibacillus soyae]MCR2806075.1 hypothetical protein [Paenibacillus soyae]
MKIWMLTTSEKCTAIESENHDDYVDHIKTYFNDEIKEWKPIRFLTRRKGNKSDCAEFMIGYPVFMRKAKDVLSPLLGSGVEFLPIIHDVHEMYFVKVKNLQDFIDMSNPVERRINYGYFSEYVHIKREMVNHSIPIFRMPPHLMTRIYVTDEFKKVVEDNKLKGFHFVELWDTEYTEYDRRERLKKFDSFYEGISSRKKVNYSEAVKLIEDGKQVRSGKHIMKVKDDLFLIGQILEDESIQWVHPTFIAPIFFELQWLVYDYIEENRIKEEFMAELSYEINGPKGSAVSFEDSSLETIIRRELNIYKDVLTEVNLLKLRSISPNYKDSPISSLKGLMFAKNLRGISIENNPEFNMNELSQLPSGIVSLSIRSCAINNISIFNELDLPMLSCIYLNENQIEDLSCLCRFQMLSHIDVISNQIKDIRPLNEMLKLDCINLRENPVENIQELQLPKIRYLYLDGIHANDWSFLLTNFPKLEYVSVSLEGMSDEEIRSIKNVKKQKKFKVVWS